MARKAIPQDRYRLTGAYERLRRALVDRPEDGSLDKELSFWVLPSDRRLPFALLDRSLRDLLACSLEDLMATPGVGQKKILCLFDLLRRAAKSNLAEEPFGLAQQKAPPEATGFDPSVVSEARWKTWCDTIKRSDLNDEKLGRLAPSLRPLPTVIWHTPLSEYVDLSLSEIRRIPTHGDKRLQAILEVFGTIHESISTSMLQENLYLDLTARFIPKLTRWITETAWEPDLPSAHEIRRCVIQPMINQIARDLGEEIADLATDRLRTDREAPSVKQQADAMGVTRARVYQLLEDCAKVMDVRWPEGRWLLAPLAGKLGGSSAEAIALIHGLRDLFFPEERPAMSLPTRLPAPTFPKAARGKS